MTTTIYGSNVHDTILSTACQMAPNSGGTETSVTTTIPSTSQPYAEFRSQGGSSTAVASLPSPTGNGWVWWCGAGSIAAGNWSAIATNSSVSKGVSTTIRFYKISSSFTYTAIGTITVTQTATGKTTYTYSSTAMSSVTTSSGDGIYIDRWWFNNNANAGSDNPVNYVSNSATAGVVNDMQVSFPTFVPASTPVSKDTAFRGNIAKLINKDSVYRGLISTIGRKDTKWRGNIGHTSLKDTKWRAVLALTSAKNTAFRGKVSNTTKKDTKWRGNIGHSVFKDTKFRGVLANTTVKNTAYRGNVGHTGAHDTTWRAHIASISLFYVSNIAQTLGGLVLSDQMSMQAGGTETSFTVTMPASGTNSYVELLAQGGSSSSTPVLPAPTGKGWSINLAGNTILAGSWSSIFTLAKSGTIKTGASLIVRYYRRTMDGVYNPIGVSTLTGQSFSTVKTVYTTPSVLQSWPFQFIQGDTLYMDAFVLNGASAWASDVFTVYVSNSATMGVYGDGTIIAPEMISTPDGLTCLIGATNFQTGDALSIRDQSITIADAVDQRSIATLVGEDIDGTLSYQRAMPVQLSDSEQGVLYTGAVNSDKVSKPAAGNSNAQLEHALTFMDNHYLVDKRKNETNYLNWSAGDMTCDFIQQTLSQEGITGQFALESDYTPETFGQGTLSGTVATTTTSPFVYAPNTATPPITSNTGDLELTRAGTKFTLTEATTSDFASGTLTNMTASGNELMPTTQSALKVITLLADPSPVVGESYWESTIDSTGASVFAHVFDVATVKIWSGTKPIGANDALNYDVWIASTSPGGQVGVDIVCSDGTTLTTYPNETATAPFNAIQSLLYDNAGYSVGPTTDLSPIAKDSWYTRTIDLTPLHGKIINTVNVFVAGTSAGTYTIYVKNIYLSSASGSPFLSTTATATQVNPPVITTTGGYASAASSTAIVAAYVPTASYRISPAHDISGVGLVQNSNITWVASLPQIGPGVPVTTNLPSAGTMLIFVSYDGVTWLPCTNAQPLPGLPAGANVASTSLYLREQFAAGPDPTAIPALEQVSITINSAAAQTTSDVVAAYGNATAWNTGSYVATSPNANGQLNNQALARTWSENQMFGQTFLPSAGGLAPGQQPDQSVSGGKYTINIPYFDFGNNENDSVISRFDFLGTGRDFTVQYDFQGNGGGNGSGGVGLCYRTGNWSKATGQKGFDWSFGYYVYASWVSDDISLWCGTNTSIRAGGNSSIATTTHTFNTNTTYTIKIQVSGSSHQVFVNGTRVINVTDSTIMTGGGIGMVAQGWYPSGTVVETNASITNLTFTPSGTWTMLQGSGYWQSPSIPLSALGTCGNTQICWAEMNRAGTPQTSALVLASIDGGTTWNQCINGATTPTASIPGLTSGTNVSGKSLQVRVIISGSEPLNLPIIYGLYARVCGNYGTVTGTRISPALSLTPVGYVAASNCMYNANIPTGTSLTVQTTQDLSTFHTVGNNGAGEALPYWTNQPDATQDLFGSNTSANYTSTSKSGGSTASVTYETALSRITLAGGSSALYVNLAINTADVDMLVDMDRSESGGMVFRFVDTSNFYEVAVYDASSSSGFANQLRLYKVASGTRTLLGSASATFTRNTFHRPRVSMQGGLINVYWDGTCLLSYLDTSPLSSGACGLRNDGGTSRYYQLWVQPLGTNLSGQVLYTKVTMTTSDPAMMPQLFTLVCCVRGPNIATGATISQLHPITKPVATYYHQEMDTLTQASGDFFWMVDKWREMHFGERLARPGAFPIQSITDQDTANPINVKSGYLLYRPQVTVLTSADLFRNRETITNVSGLVTPPPEIKVCDGSVTSWQMGYPLYSAPIILINGQPATIGLQGTDNNRQFYWQPGSASISYDSSLPKLPAGTVLSFTYVGESPVDVELNNTASQIAQAALELNSGIVDEITSALNNTAAGMNTDQATVFGQGLLDRYGKNDPIALSGTTRYIGLAPGTTIALFAPEMLSVWNAQLPITKLTTMVQKGVGGLIWTYAVDATNGPSISNWTRMWRPK